MPAVDPHPGVARSGAGSHGGKTTGRAKPIPFAEPRLSRWLFGSAEGAWTRPAARLWLGWEWIHAGWRKVSGGGITWKAWEWGRERFSLFGDGNIGWIRGSGEVGVGDRIAAFPGAVLSSSFVFAGSAGVSPMMNLLSGGASSSPGATPGGTGWPGRCCRPSGVPWERGWTREERVPQTAATRGGEPGPGDSSSSSPQAGGG